MRKFFKIMMAVGLVISAIVCQSCDEDIDGNGSAYYADISIDAPDSLFNIGECVICSSIGYQEDIRLSCYSPSITISADEITNTDFGSFLYDGGTFGKPDDRFRGERVEAEDIQGTYTFSDGASITRTSDNSFVLNNLPTNGYSFTMYLSTDARTKNKPNSKRKRIHATIRILG
ncbi:MAG: hypothetical protein U0L83_02070 [Muribaculaceae bacterium]|nr:hypothetical protein [Muribaculaceae bacterium]